MKGAKVPQVVKDLWVQLALPEGRIGLQVPLEHDKILPRSQHLALYGEEFDFIQNILTK